MHKEYILLNGFRKAKKGFTAGFHVPLTLCFVMQFESGSSKEANDCVHP